MSKGYRSQIIRFLATLLFGASALFFTSAAFAIIPYQPPVSWEDADSRANEILGRMTTEQKLSYINGHNTLFFRGFPELGIPELYLADATQGVHIRHNLPNPMKKSTAFPSTVSLAATWNPELAQNYAKSVGEECRAGGVAILLGPGMNIYRNSQCGRNFEYFGEDPFLAARMIEHFTVGVSETGIVPTLKHFVANNSDWHRRTSNSIIDERTLHEIYLPAFQAGIDAGALAVMTSYNQLNGEWVGQDHYAITELLRGEMGFKWLVMTDWWSVFDAQKIIESGQDIEMPGSKFIARDAARLLEEGAVTEDQINRMVRSLLRTTIAAGLFDRPLRDESYYETFPAHVETALETAREGIVLLKNNGLLPLDPKNTIGTILITGTFAEDEAFGGGAAQVEGYDFVSMRAALEAIYGGRVIYRPFPTDTELAVADVVIQSIGTRDHEGWDRPFELPSAEKAKVERALRLNSKTIVVVNSGSAVGMSDWNEKAPAILYGWYPGQIGNQALAEIIAGEVNPSGHLPFSIERKFEDSPAHGYLPDGAEYYEGWSIDADTTFPINDIHYTEGVFVGYRWYDVKGFSPLYAFGHGLSYSTFEYSDLKLETAQDENGDPYVTVNLKITNTSRVPGTEVAQLYVGDPTASVLRPTKELKGFTRTTLVHDESKTVEFTLDARDFSFWDSATDQWVWEPGKFIIYVGSASDDIRLEATIEVE